MSSTGNVQPNIAALIAIVLFIAIFIYLIITATRNDMLEAALKREKLVSELRLSERLEAEKIKTQFESFFVECHGELATYETQTTLIASKLTAAQQKIRWYESQNTKQSRDRHHARQFQEEISTLRKDKLKLEFEKDSIWKFSQQLIATNAVKLKILRDSIGASKWRYLTVAGMQASRKNKKLTIKSRRTKSIRGEMEIAGPDNVYSCMVMTPCGETIYPDSQEISIRASKTQTGSRLIIEYTPTKRMTAGKYIIEVSGEGVIGRVLSTLE